MSIVYLNDIKWISIRGNLSKNTLCTCTGEKIGQQKAVSISRRDTHPTSNVWLSFEGARQVLYNLKKGSIHNYINKNDNIHYTPFMNITCSQCGVKNEEPGLVFFKRNAREERSRDYDEGEKIGVHELCIDNFKRTLSKIPDEVVNKNIIESIK